MDKDARRPESALREYLEATDGVTVVTPTRRLAHWLKQRFDAANVAQGRLVWKTPDIVTWAELVERTFAADRRAGRTDLRWLSDAGAHLAWERLVRRDPDVTHVIAPEGIGYAAYRAWGLLHDYEIPLAALESDLSPEVAAFARWAAAFTRWMADGRWLDAAQAASQVDPASAPRHVRCIGFGVFTPAQESLLRRLADTGVVVEHAREDVGPGTTFWVPCLDRRAEVETAARWAAGRLQHAPGEQLAIVVPGLAQRREAVRRTLDKVLAPRTTVSGGPAPESVGYELAAARALGERPIVTAALQWLGGFSHETDLADCGALLRNPFCGAAAAESSARAQLDAWVRRHETARLPLSRLAAHASRRSCPQLAQLLRAGLARVAQWPRRARPSAWAHEFDGLLRDLGWPGDGLDTAEHQAWQRWQTLLGEFGASDDVVGSASAGEALRLLSDLAASALFEPQELRAPLLVIDPQTCAGMRFDALWVCGLESGQWPPPASPTPFLPFDWQRRRGVPGASAEISAAEAQRTLDRLRASAPEVILSVPQFEDEAPLLPSALLDGIPMRDAPRGWESTSYARMGFEARPVLEAFVDGAMPALPADESTRGGARLLELQAACPFRAQAELRLGARAVEEPSLGLDPAARGELVHDVLRQLWVVLRERRSLVELTEPQLRERVRGAVDACIEPLRREADAVLRQLLGLEASWLEARVLELLAEDRKRPEFSIAGTEQDHTVEIGGLLLSVRLDRVDRLADGSLAVIDYKTGGDVDAKSWLDERPKLPQLPLYVEALGPGRVSAVAFGRVRSGETGYVGLGRDGQALPGIKTVGLGSRIREFDSWEQLLATWHRRLESLAREYVAGDARLAPDPAHACRYCHLPTLCRIGETQLGAAGEEGGDDE